MSAGSIVFDLLMRTASFETDTKRAEKRLKALQKEAEAFGKAFGVAVVGGASAATYALLETINAMDEASKGAQKVGVTTEAFTGLAHAAKLADLDTADLTKTLVKLSTEASTGNDAFKAMGIDVRDATGKLKAADVLLGEVADKFAGYEEGAERTALAVELFGEKVGPKLIPLLASGSKGIAEMTKEARALGLVIDTETGKAAEEFNDNLTRLGGASKGFANEVAAGLLPILREVTDEMVRGAKEGGGYGKIFSDAIAVALQTVIVLGSDVAFVFKGIGRDIGGMAAQLVALARLDFDSFTFLGDAMKADAAKAREELDAFQARVMGVGDAVKAAAEGAGAAGVVAPDVAAEKARAKAAAEAEKERIAALKKAAQEAAKARADLQAEGRRLAEAVQTPSERLASTQSNVNRLAGAGVIDPEVQRRALDEAQGVYDAYVQKQRQLLTDGLLTDEQEIQASYDRRRQMILALTEATETEKADAVAAITDQRDAQLAKAHLQRYGDLLSEEERVTKEYMERKRQIEDDEALTAEKRYEYLTALSEKYHARMQELDEADAAKREELSRKQIEMVSSGFGNMADIAKAFQGEQSRTYQALFAASKAFTVADITLKQAQAIAKAWGENNYWVAIGLTAGLAAQFAGLVSSANSASFGGARADGGPVNAGRSYLVGERGPEYFTPNEGGRIVPGDAMAPRMEAQPIRIVNAFDDGHIDDYLGSDAGERKIVNAVRRNRAALGLT